MVKHRKPQISDLDVLSSSAIGVAVQKHIYDFSEGGAEMIDLLGGKGANVAEMARLGIPVPPGFVITTETCRAFNTLGQRFPAGLVDTMDAALARLETQIGKQLGNADDPLLVSVRSGAAVSMPGMMDTVLNLGLNDRAVVGLARKSGNVRFAWDAYRRFVQMFGNVVLNIPHAAFEEALEAAKGDKGVQDDTALDARDLVRLVDAYKTIVRSHTGAEFPQEPLSQLHMAVRAVFLSWENPRAQFYRKLNGISGLAGTAVTVQAMVFGNMGEDSGTGVVFSRNPATGEKCLFGEFLMNAQGEDVVAGIRTPEPIAGLRAKDATVAAELERVAALLEAHYGDMQDIEFTVERGRLFLLQTRNGKRSARAAVKVAVDLVAEGVLDRNAALLRVDPKSLDQLLHPQIDPAAARVEIAKGLPASPGAASGAVVFSADAAEQAAAAGRKVILVRRETSPEDIHGMHAAEGILTALGGMTSHAAVVARGMGKCCVSGAPGLTVLEAEGRLITASGHEIAEGDIITLDGSTGQVLLGAVPTIAPTVDGDLATLLSWADEVRTLAVRANADTPADARRAREFGAQGIGLCRTEHMFFDPARILAMREMIVAENAEARRVALAKLLPYQRADFRAILTAMAGLPVTIRLLDPPLHEFLPHGADDIVALASDLGITTERLQARLGALKESNPMMGHRGCRLMITYPEIAEMQARAIFEAAAELRREGVDAIPEIMVPLVGIEGELTLLSDLVKATAKTVLDEQGVAFAYSVGTMIELPRACLQAGAIAQTAQFFSFGTNDLTQFTFGFSRDDAGKFVSAYRDKGLLDADPFASLDRNGVGELIDIAMQRGRAVRPGLKTGICGEHGGDPASIAFAHAAGLDYVSCSPFRVPVARLAAAHAALKDDGQRLGAVPVAAE
jgi:pyruvate, orthophosphate dikinase